MQKPRVSSAARGGNSVVGPAMLALLVWVGSLKETPLLDWIPGLLPELPIDLTLITAGVVAICTVDSRLRGGAAHRTGFAPWAVFALLFLPAVIVAGLPSAYSSSKITTLFTITFLLALAPFYLLRTARQRKVFLATLLGLGGIAAANLVFAPTVVEGSLGGRFVLEGGNTIAISRIVLAAAVILFIGSTIRGQSLGRRLLMVFVGVCLVGAATLTGSRGPIISTGVALATVLVLATVYRKYRVRAIIGILLIGGVGFWYVSANSESEGLARIVGSLTGESAGGPESRIAIWGHAVTLIATSVLGRGWGSFEFFGTPYPHNVLLEIGAEAGVLVLAAVIVLLIATTVRGARMALDWPTTAMFGLFIFALANAMVSADINGNRLLIVASFALWVSTKPKAEEQNSEAEVLPARPEPSRVSAGRTTV